MASRTIPAGLISVGFQKVTANSTAVAVNSTIRARANVLHVSVETRAVRYRMDSTAPTASTGVLLTTTSSPYWFDYNGTAGFRVVKSTSTDAAVQVQGYRYPGQGAR